MDINFVKKIAKKFVIRQANWSIGIDEEFHLSYPYIFKSNLYYANDLMGIWIEHPQSPVIEGDRKIPRLGGRVVMHENKVIKYTQDDEYIYGNQVRAFEITKLTTENYEERAVSNNPIIQGSGRGWNKIGMHNINSHQIDKNK